MPILARPRGRTACPPPRPRRRARPTPTAMPSDGATCALAMSYLTLLRSDDSRYRWSPLVIIAPAAAAAAAERRRASRARRGRASKASNLIGAAPPTRRGCCAYSNAATRFRRGASTGERQHARAVSAEETSRRRWRALRWLLDQTRRARPLPSRPVLPEVPSLPSLPSLASAAAHASPTSAARAAAARARIKSKRRRPSPENGPWPCISRVFAQRRAMFGC